MSKLTRLGNDLFSGRRSVDFVGRKWTWYAISAVVIVAAVLGLALKGPNLGIDFTGGTRYTVTIQSRVDQQLADKLRDAVGNAGVEAAATPNVTTAGRNSVVIETKPITEDSANDTKVTDAIKKAANVSQSDVSRTGIGASWGARVAKKALTGLLVFLLLVMIFIWAYFKEWKMSVAAIVALLHDVVITVGVYTLVGFEVTPATVTGFLTILGFSLYDTVVVFDKVRENTKDLRRSKMSYAQAANLALNQTLVRSVNTSIVALLPVVAILVVSTVLLGTSTLKDIALALFVGMAAGLYSSIFIATPLLVHLKSREKEVVDSDRRAAARAKKADKYAEVPTYHDGMPVPDASAEEPEELREDVSDDDHELYPATARPVPNDSAMGRGRNAPTQHRPVSEGGSAGRPQPKREPRSKRK
ncbi:MAG: protein translocase subunit SecF [Nocardioides sp.]|nr:protein translocase subunit SecF [Nocardioides sp.]